MLKLSGLTILSAIIICTLQTYDAIFTLSWLSGFCEGQAQNHRQQCQASMTQLWDNQSHTIHGLWAAQESQQTYGSFNISIFQNQIKLLDDMNNYWPPKVKASASNVFLWEHEWQKHGKDYAHIIYTQNPDHFPGDTQQRNAALQLTFFKDVIALYKSLNVQKLMKSTFERKDYANKIGVQEENFEIVCYKEDYLMEIRFCYEISKSGIQSKKCEQQSQSCSSQGATFELSNWKFKGQRRVFDYPTRLSLSSE